MKNIVAEMDYLKKCLDSELTLREMASAEFDRGEQNGEMRQAHDQIIQSVLFAAQTLIDKSKE